MKKLNVWMISLGAMIAWTMISQGDDAVLHALFVTWTVVLVLAHYGETLQENEQLKAKLRMLGHDVEG